MIQLLYLIDFGSPARSESTDLTAHSVIFGGRYNVNPYNLIVGVTGLRADTQGVDKGGTLPAADCVYCMPYV